MTQAWAAIALLAALVTTPARSAEACACCDAKMTRTPVGWSADGALLVDARDNHACEAKARLEVYRAPADEPASCYDLFGEPDKEIACTDLTSRSSSPRKSPARTSAVARKAFATRATRMAASRYRVKRSWASLEEHSAAHVVIELRTKAGWTPAWSGELAVARSGTPVVEVSLWPNARGDRALVLVSYTQSGTGNQQVDVHWATLAM